jgi:L-seryl-tRNA(Ser) seleniumtransferase
MERPPLRRVLARVKGTAVAGGVRSFFADVRMQLRERTHPISIPPAAELAARVAGLLGENRSPVRPVINATGILLPSNLGRAPLADKAIERMAAVAREYASVDFDLASGEPAGRQRAASGLVCELTGALEAAVVNSHAAAIVLAVAALAQGREVVVSRGELLELEEHVRLPELIRSAGARLREVGTTNKTSIGDYRDVLGPETAAVLRVHRGNCRLIGSTDRPSLPELADLARLHSVPLVECLGPQGGLDLARYGLLGEPTAAMSIEQGADLVLFSGDGRLGGPPCGIIAGTEALVDRLSRHPLARALQVDKLTLAALTATLEIHRDEQTATREVPLLQLLSAPLENLRQRAERIASQVARGTIGSAEARASEAYLSEARLPDERLASWCVVLAARGANAAQLAARLRQGSPPIVGRLDAERLHLDLRTVFPRQDQEIVDTIARAG